MYVQGVTLLSPEIRKAEVEPLTAGNERHRVVVAHAVAAGPICVGCQSKFRFRRRLDFFLVLTTTCFSESVRFPPLLCSPARFSEFGEAEVEAESGTKDVRCLTTRILPAQNSVLPAC